MEGMKGGRGDTDTGRRKKSRVQRGEGRSREMGGSRSCLLERDGKGRLIRKEDKPASTLGGGWVGLVS